jgi:SAM-dependent methyltransferase
MLSLLRRWLVDPRVRALDVDAVDFSVAHRRVLTTKPLLQHLFRDFYADCRRMDDTYFSGGGTRLEIGSGSGFMSDVYPDVVTSDLKPLPFVQLVCRGERMPVRDASLRAVYAINTFHHLPSPASFFRELERVLAPGGGAVFIEPYFGPAAQFLFKRLHASETFDTAATSWDSDPAAGPFSRANQALSYIVFVRDRDRFAREFPQLELLTDRPHTHLRYLLSGGVNFRQLVPNAADRLVIWLERAMTPLARLLALQHTIVIRRRSA